MPECPYCKKTCEARGLKNHIRLAGGEHGEPGELPEDYDGAQTDADGAQSDSEDGGTDSVVDPEDADSGDAEATEVTADDLGDTEPESPEPDDSDADDGYPFDPDADGAIELDGDENLYVAVDGEMTECTPSKGDFLLITDGGPILWDHETDERYEVITA